MTPRSRYYPALLYVFCFVLGLLLGLVSLVFAQGGEDQFEILGLLVRDNDTGEELIARFETLTPDVPTASATPSPSPSNTFTPSPSPTDDPPDPLCVGTVNTTIPLRVRSDPRTGIIITSLTAGTEVTIVAFTVYDEAVEEWAWLVGPVAGHAASTFAGDDWIDWDRSNEFCYPPYVQIIRPGEPTPTPRAPTWTPSPTLSPTPQTPVTDTPVPTSGPFVTPTPDSGVPTSTPGGPSGVTCELRSGVSSINIRSTTSLSAPIIDRWAAREGRIALGFTVANGYLWAIWREDPLRVSAVYEYSTRSWFIEGTPGSDRCQDVPGWPEGLTPPVPIASIGWLLYLGVDMNLVMELGSSLKAAGITPAATLVGNENQGCLLTEAGFVVNTRPWYSLGLGDGPDMSLPPEESARRRFEALRFYAQTLCFTYLQLTNEIAWPNAEYLNRWILESTRLCDEEGWRCIPVVWNTGTPPIEYMKPLTPALNAMRQGGHAWGMNVGPYEPGRLLCEDDMFTAYLTWRIRLLKAAAVTLMPDVFVTEAARGNATLPPNVNDAACFVDKAWTERLFQHITLWYHGSDSVWGGSRWFRAAMVEFVARLIELRLGRLT